MPHHDVGIRLDVVGDIIGYVGQLQWIIAEALRKSGRMKKKRNQSKEEES